MVGKAPQDLEGELLDVILTGSSRILMQTHAYPALAAHGRVDELLLTLVDAHGEAIPVLFYGQRTVDTKEPLIDALVMRIPARARWERELLEATRALEAERTETAKLARDLGEAHEDLKLRYAQEQRNRQFREALIGLVSHELRNPITTIIGLAHRLQQLSRDAGNAALAEDLDDLGREAERMRRLTEDLLVMSRAEAGHLEIEPEPVHIENVVRRVVNLANSQASEQRVEMGPTSGVPLVAGDALHVEQVAINLASNAVKYSPPGTAVRVTVEPEDDGATVRVIDGGPGLGEQPPERLFDLYYRAPSARLVARGAGIGLYVCRELVSAMGGRIWAKPVEPPPGAEFGFWLPAWKPEAG